MVCETKDVSWYLVTCALNEEGLTERAFTKKLDLIIVLKLLPLLDVVHLIHSI
jgi:hypothetical protein